MRANTLNIKQGSWIETVGNTADAGKLVIQAGTIYLGGLSGNYNSGLATNSYGQGNSGQIIIQADELLMKDGAYLFSTNYADGNAGNIDIQLTDNLTIRGASNATGYPTGIFSSVLSRENEHGGNAGNINISATEIRISDGGNISIQADNHITISGDASHIKLKEPLSGQLYYLINFTPQTYNQSTSGIYAYSTSRAVDSGDSGHIKLSTPQLTLGNKGQISTASQGGGKAGQIILNVEKLVLSDDALIRSNSDLNNQFAFDNSQARDNSIIGLGTVVKTIDIGNGKSVYQINLGKTLLNIMPITSVTDIAALEILPEQINLASNGDIFMVENVGNGQSARFLYANYTDSNQTWTRINEDDQVILEQANSLSTGNFVDGVQPPYADGTPIHIKNMGNGKSADFVYVVRTFFEGPNIGIIRGTKFRVKYYQASDTNALQELTANTDLGTGTQVHIDNAGDGNSANLVFDGNDWVSFGQELEVADIKAQENLVLAEAGNIANLPTGNTIYTGSEWINLGQTYRVNNLIERNGLNIQHGDLVKVADTGNGRHDAFLFADGKWITQIRGGDAGQIVINADSIQLTDGSEISTGSISGGSVTLNVNELVYLNNSQVSTSVQEGVGSGGNLTITNPQFIINNGKIIAQAFEGKGGNIRLTSKQIISSPNSITSASSKLGIDGDINVESLDVDLTGALKAFGINFLNAAAHMKRPCTIEDIMEPDTFYVFHLTGSQPSPADFIANELVLIEEEENIDVKAEVKESKSVDWTSCRPELLASNI